MKKRMKAAAAAMVIAALASVFAGCGETNDNASAGATLPTAEQATEPQETNPDMEAYYKTLYPNLVFPEGFDFSVLFVPLPASVSREGETAPTQDPSVPPFVVLTEEEIRRKIEEYQLAHPTTEPKPSEDPACSEYRAKLPEIRSKLRSWMGGNGDAGDFEILGAYYDPEGIGEQLNFLCSYVRRKGEVLESKDYTCISYLEDNPSAEFLDWQYRADSLDELKGELKKVYSNFDAWIKLD